MDREALSGLSPIWLIGLALALGVTVVTLVPITFAGRDAITPGSWIGFCGSVLGGSLTVIGFFVAANNVNRQLRVNLISREESRIEEQLPQMDELIDHVLDMLSANENGLAALWEAMRKYRDEEASDLTNTVRSDGGRSVNWQITDRAVAAHMSVVDPTLRRRFLGALSELRLGLDAVDGRVIIVEESGYRAGLALLQILMHEAIEKTSTYKKRLVVFRAELERYFER